MILMPTLAMGGAERVISWLLAGFDRDHVEPQLALVYPRERHYEIPSDVAVFTLEPLASGEDAPALPDAEVARPLTLPAELAAAQGDAFEWLEGVADSFAALVDRERPDVVLAGMLWTSVIACLARPKLPNETAVILRADAIGSQAFAGEHGDLYEFLGSKLFCQADEVLAVSEGVADDLCEHFGLRQDSVLVERNPIDVATVTRLATEPVSHPAFDAGVPVVLFTGRLEPVKGVDVLLRALADVAGTHDFHCIIVGDGGERASLEALTATLGIGQRVSFVGAQKNPYAFMARSTLFALSSRHEGMGNVVIEALATGCPVVASDVPGGTMRFLLKDGECGAIVEPESPAALAEAIRCLLADEAERERLAVCGRGRALEFDLPLIVRQTEGIMRDVSERRRRAVSPGPYSLLARYRAWRTRHVAGRDA